MLVQDYFFEMDVVSTSVPRRNTKDRTNSDEKRRKGKEKGI